MMRHKAKVGTSHLIMSEAAPLMVLLRRINRQTGVEYSPQFIVGFLRNNGRRVKEEEASLFVAGSWGVDTVYICVQL